MAWTYTVDRLAEILGAHPPGVSTRFEKVSTDTRTIEAGEVFFALKGENFDGNEFVGMAFEKGAAAAVATEPYRNAAAVATEPYRNEAVVVVRDPLDALQRFAHHHRAQYTHPLIAITGSCGKTSCKDLAAAVLATKYSVVKTMGNLNNEIGCPLSLLRLAPNTERAVMEMGANHRGEIARLCALARPTEAAITMISEAHLEGFGTLEQVAEAKAEIVDALPDSAVFYVNGADPHCMAIAQSFRGQKVIFGPAGQDPVPDVALRSCDFDAKGEMHLAIEPIGEIRLPLYARAHTANVLLAIAIGLQHGVQEFEGPLREACKATARLKVMKVGPLEIVDDTYNANPSSVLAALEALRDRPAAGIRMAALGEMLELGDAAKALHRGMGRAAGELGVTRLFARGEHARDMIDGAMDAHVTHAEAIEGHAEMAQAIHALAQPGDVLLVKGSRGMAMENVIEALKELYGET